MKIVSIDSLALPDVKVIRYARFADDRGYFTEIYRKGNFVEHQELNFVEKTPFVQCNESFSRKGVIRGLHFQWNPYMGKLVRTVFGHMMDFVMDIRLNSPTFGKIIIYDMPHLDENEGEWIWVPPGFAHGNCFLEETLIEYFCTGEYSPGCEAGISPVADDLDWSLCDHELYETFKDISNTIGVISEKDQVGLSLESWKSDERAQNFVYGNI